MGVPAGGYRDGEEHGGMTNSWNQGGVSGYTTISDEGSTLPQRRVLNFTGATVTATDDAANSRTTITINAAASGYQTIQEEGSAVAQRSTLDFAGANVTVTDDAANSRTLVTITTAGGALRGLASARPAASTVTNSIYYETDTGAVWESDGTSWILITIGDTLEQGSTTYRSALRRGSSSENMTLTSGTEQLTAVRLAEGDVVGSLGFIAGTTGWTAGTGGHLFFTLRTPSRVLIGTTADSPTSAWNAGKALVLPLSLAPGGGARGAYTATATGLYYAGCVTVAGTGGTVPSLSGVAGYDGEMGDLAGNGATVLAATGLTGLTNPASANSTPTLTTVGSRAQAFLLSSGSVADPYQTPAVVQAFQIQTNTAASTHTATVPAGGIAAGHTLIIRVYTNLGTNTMDALSGSDTRGNTYQTDATRATAASGSTLFVLSARVTTALQAGDTITLSTTLTGSPALAVLAGIVSDVTGVANASRVVGSPQLGSSSTATGSWSAGTFNQPAGSPVKQLIVGALGSNNSTASLSADTSPWTSSPVARVGTTPTVRDIYGWYKVQTDANYGSHTLAGTMTTTSAYAAAIVAYAADLV